jgi:hypothetical protein
MTNWGGQLSRRRASAGGLRSRRVDRPAAQMCARPIHTGGQLSLVVWGAGGLQANELIDLPDTFDPGDRSSTVLPATM